MKRSVLRVSRLLSVFAVAGMLWMPAQVLALSVTTNDIVDGAVTTPKIYDGAVTDAKISGIISGAKLGAHGHSGADVLDGTITSSKVADGAVTLGKIADGAVTNAKISGTIGVEKIGSYSGVKLVHKGVADGANTFNSIQAAIDSITDASQSNPYLIKVMPGTYSEAVTLKNGVNVEGSGQDETIITFNADIINIPAGSVTSLRKVTVLLPQTTPYTITGITNGGTDFSLSDSKIYANSSVTSGNVMGVYSYGNKFTINNCIIDTTSPNAGVYSLTLDGPALIKNTEISSTAAGYTQAVNCWGNGLRQMLNTKISATSTTNSLTQGISSCSNLEITNSTIYVDLANQNAAALNDSTVTVNNSIISGKVIKGSGVFKIGNSQFAGNHDGVLGVDKIVNCHNSSFDPINF